MSKILNVSQGDYRIKVPTGNSITLDTGVLAGSVIITGDLDIKGQTTTIESTNATIKDNIIVLNNGEPHTNGSGITLGTAGIYIDRGTDNAVVLTAKMLFNEAVSHYNPFTSVTENGTYVLSTSRDSTDTLASLKIASVELSAISNNGTNINGIEFNLRSTNTTLTVINSTYNTVSYENRLIDSSLTTKLYVNRYVVAGNLKPAPTFTPFLGSMADVDTIYKKTADVPGTPGSIKAMVETTTTSEIYFKIDTAQRAVITSNGLSVDTLNLFGTTLKNTGAGPLILKSDINLVEVDSVLTLDNQSLAQTTAISGKTKVYSQGTEGPGRTGIYFTNNNTYGANAYNNDELVSRNRAVLLSMLF